MVKTVVIMIVVAGVSFWAGSKYGQQVAIGGLVTQGADTLKGLMTPETKAE